MNRRTASCVRALLGVTLLGLAFGTASGQTYSCAPANGDDAVALKDYVTALVTAGSSTPRLYNARATYQLPGGPPTIVSVEKKRSVCQAAAIAYHNKLHPNDPPVNRAMVVIKVGSTRYVVLDPAEPADEFAVHMVFDAAWQWIISFAS